MDIIDIIVGNVTRPGFLGVMILFTMMLLAMGAWRKAYDRLCLLYIWLWQTCTPPRDPALDAVLFLVTWVVLWFVWKALTRSERSSNR